MNNEDLDRTEERIQELKRLLRSSKGDRTMTQQRASWSEEYNTLNSALAAAKREEETNQRLQRKLVGFDTEFYDVVRDAFPKHIIRLEEEAIALHELRVKEEMLLKEQKAIELDQYLSRLPSIDTQAVRKRLEQLKLRVKKENRPGIKASLIREQQYLSGWLQKQVSKGNGS